MKFSDDSELKLLLKDQKYCRDADSFCLGETMEEAAEVIQELMKQAEAERENYVGVD